MSIRQTRPDYHDVFFTVQVYKELVYDITINCANEAVKTGVKRFINVSTAQVYNSDKVIHMCG